jgi:ligand-binding sensor domain-containing protein
VGGGGAVFAATSEGVAVFDGRVWAVPRLLQRRASALTVGPDARLWMATPRGVATYDGARVRRLDARRGLLEDEIWDVKIDRFRRVWALSPSGLSVLSVK